MNFTKQQLALFWIALVHISGAIGMLFQPDFFLPLTAVNLLSTAAILLWLDKWLHAKAFFIIAILGWCIEWLGVHTEVIFGTYSYGENLGWKWSDIPLVIGINWALLVISFYQTFLLVWPNHSLFVRASLTATGMVALDALIESAAPRMDFWSFDTPYPPLQNFIAWWVVTFLLVLLIHFLKGWEKKASHSYGLVFLFIQFVFFFLLICFLS